MTRVLRKSARLFQLCRIIRYRIFLLVLLYLQQGARCDLGRIQELMQGMSTGTEYTTDGDLRAQVL